MTKVVIFNIDSGDFEQGFPVTLRIGKEGENVYREEEGYFPPSPEILTLSRNFQENYNNLESVQRAILVDPAQITNVSSPEECRLAARSLENHLKKWFQHPSVAQLRIYVEEEVSKTESAHIIFQTNNEILKKLPWHLWELFKNRRRAWFSLGARFAPPSKPLKRPVKILAILGSDERINVRIDENLLNSLPGAKVTPLRNPTQNQLCEILWENSWDILCFSGHSYSQDGGRDGVVQLSNIDSPALSNLRNAFTQAIENGLKLAIFNSCDGLGLANQLAELRIPQVIVMREPVPDEVAQKFLREFLHLFSQGERFYLAVRQAQEKLQFIENQYPCASWLPVICQNPAEPSPLWPETIIDKIKRRSLKFWRTRKLASFVILAIISLPLATLIALNLQNKGEIIPPPISTSKSIQNSSNIDKFFSRGDKILIKSKMNSEKERGKNAFATGDWNLAINHFLNSIRLDTNDPETLIYLNNAIAKKKGNQLAIAVTVPIGESLDSTYVAQEILRGVAHAQSQLNCGSVDNIATAIQNNQPSICMGGSNNKPLLVEIVDDKNNSEFATQIAQTLVSDRNKKDILAVIGHYRSETTIAAVNNGYNNKILVISPTSTSTKLDRLPYKVLRTVISDSISVQNLYQYVNKKLNSQSIRAVVAYDEGEAFSDSVKDAFQKELLTLPHQQDIPKYNLRNYSVQEILKKVQQEKANVILLAPSGTNENLQKALELVKEVANLQSNSELILLGASTMYRPGTTSPEFGKASEKSKLVVATPWHRNGSLFEQNAKKLWGKQSEVNWVTAMTYDATQAIIESLNRTNTPDRKQLMANLFSNVGNFSAEGATAKVQFTAEGNRVFNNRRDERLGVLVKVQCDGSSCNFVDENSQP
ncbi:ABC transporter substrate-binding protein [Scytonema sp. UIC 10036]|uniref:ABC transporter substrate-binding protein n=1 Tax=Scytonema sp. UIC 10036 TaxID=2304196 RepID=UPI00140F8C98|nr:ABC transporter substrate-binding protein [Scytonema sp. UIC 10036]